VSTFPKASAIIVAAGESRRMEGVDKVLAPLAGKPLISWTVDTFQNCDVIGQILVVTSEKNCDRVRQMSVEKGWTKVTGVCLGGKLRQDSVAVGLAKIDGAEWVVVQDGARPFVTPELIRQGLEFARETGSAIAAVPVSDTIKMTDDNLLITQTIPRHKLWSVQTPQVFRYSILKEAYERIKSEVTDDASLVEELGHKVKIYPGSYENIKITTPRDLIVAECIARVRGK
jgi:2-C-methyl-D-erythritol 4-phosphate cytidylyltransferase